MDNFRKGSTIFTTSLTVAITVTAILAGLEKTSEVKSLTKEAMEEFNLEIERTLKIYSTMDSIDKIIFKEITENRIKKLKPQFPTQNRNRGDSRLMRFRKKLTKLLKKNFKELGNFRYLIYGILLCSLTSLILYYNIDVKVKALLLNYIALLVENITQLENFQGLLKNYKDKKFSKPPMTESEIFELKALEKVESNTRFKHRAAMAKLYSLARSMNLNRRKSLLFMILALAYWRYTAQKSMEDFLLFLSWLGKLLGSENDPEQF